MSLQIDSLAATIGARITAAFRDPDRVALDATIATAPLSPSSTLEPLPSIPITERASERGTAPADLEVLDLLGEGGMGLVHLAHQRSLDRDVALKTVRVGSSTENEIALLVEARVTGRLEHPNIVPVHAVGVAGDGRPVMVMKRIDGVSWQALLDDDDHPASASLGAGDRLDRHLRIVIAVARALEFAHRRGVVHRDVKPDNVMVGRFGEVYLVDWGLAVDTGTPSGSSIVGTPLYMAPEMIDGRPVDARTDVYLLGGLLHELLTRKPPHEGDTLQGVLMNAYLAAPPEYEADVPPELADIARRALAREPDDRFADAGAMRAELEDFQVHRAVLELTNRSERQMDALIAEMEEVGAAAGSVELPTPEIETRRAALRRRVMECRFGFHMAVEQWRDNARARLGLRRCAEAEVELSLVEGNPHAARHALEALVDAPAELVARVCSAEAALRAAERARQQARQVLRDLDERVGMGTRRTFAFILGVLHVVSGIAAAIASARGDFSARDALVMVLGADVLVAVSAVFARDALHASAYNRRFAGLVAVMLAGVTLNRLVGWVQDDAVATVLIRDGVMIAAVAAAGAVAFISWLGWTVPLMLGAALVASVWPRWAALGFVLALLLTLVVVLRRWEPRQIQE
jgi:eukaryotic-like serine/threonine-protein kinase